MKNKATTMKKLKTRQTIKDESQQDEVYEKCRQSNFKQQNLPAWRPVPTIKSILVVFCCIAVMFCALGIILLVMSSKLKTVEFRYDEECNNKNQCPVTINIEDDMDQPIMIYYQLDGYFQNSRRYVKSKSIGQLKGETKSYKNIKDDCDPVRTNKEMGLEGKNSIDGTPLVADDPAFPCGLVAKTFFNDTYYDWKINNDVIFVDENDIAFSKDKSLYDNPGDQSKAWTNITNEHFLVWMRPSGLPEPKKLWGRIRNDLKKGDQVHLTIENNFDVSLIEGKKKLILSTVNDFGGKNKLLGIGFVVVGCIAALSAIVFTIYNGIQERKEKQG